MEDVRTYLAAAVGEVGMAWAMSSGALLDCRRTGQQDLGQIAVELNGIGVALTNIEDRLKRIFESSQ